MRLIICLSLFLMGCNEFPSIQPQERCFVILNTTLDDSHCRCHMYEWTKDHIGRITESENKPITYCDKMGGFKPDETGRIYEWQESIRLWINRQNKPSNFSENNQ